ncbi:RNA polymerase sigma-70 factor [Flammeovirgaceae bacterium SG7u.111]|nr:RNA polymerase sigma-70 factor [Flammeovirgaceae bacterium SG7u.132]WPO37611.1 RNA polymerase sigma-70 factor [Flammeovirgaceae bacterium SG7u.111]
MEKEKVLVLQLKAGNEVAFKQLFVKHYQKVFYFAFNYLKVKEDAEEIVHDVFVQVWNNKHKLNEDLSFEGFVRTIARNLIYNQFKKKDYHQLYLNYIQAHETHICFNTEEQIEYNELKQLTQEAIEKLSPRKREIFNLSRTEGLSHQEIADSLGISIRTVKDQMTKALNDIRQYLTTHTHVPHSFILIFLMIF